MNKILTKMLYWLLQLTWGILLNVIGAIVFLVFLIKDRRVYFYNGSIVKIIGNYGGCFSLGAFLFVSENCHINTLKHEYGHSIQNIIFGPFMVLVVSIPSCLRYWIRQLFKMRSKPYDSIWFEGWATNLGYKYAK